MLLTELKVKNARPESKMYRISDGDGLVLQITPQGGRYWRLRYFYAGKEKMLALGTYPEVSLSDARDRRFNARKDLSNGIDPGAKKREQKRLAIFKAGNTFQAVAQEWFDNNQHRWVPQHSKALWRRLEMHIFPELGNVPIADICALQLLDVIQKIEKRGTTEASKRVAQTCTLIFRHAVLTKRVASNPATDLRGVLKPHVSKHFPTISSKELPEFFGKLKNAHISRQSYLAVRLCPQSVNSDGKKISISCGGTN